MPVSPYFNNFPSENRLTNEHRLMEDVIVESIQIMGQNVWYILRESYDKMDLIYGETTQIRFDKAYRIEAYMTNVEGFEGDGDFFSKFGLEIRDNSNFVLSRRSFERIVPSSLRIRPMEGDLIWVPLLHRMFEVKFIEKKLMFFSLGNRHPFVYEMRCEDFRYSNEAIDTGIKEIDDVEEENAYAVKLKLSSNNSVGSFRNEEIVFQSTDGTWANNFVHGTIKHWSVPNNEIFLFNTSGEFVDGIVLRGNTSAARWMVSSVNDSSSNNSIYDFSNNEEFNSDTTLILDLSEINPFGSI